MCRMTRLRPFMMAANPDRLRLTFFCCAPSWCPGPRCKRVCRTTVDGFGAAWPSPIDPGALGCCWIPASFVIHTPAKIEETSLCRAFLFAPNFAIVHLLCQFQRTDLRSGPLISDPFLSFFPKCALLPVNYGVNVIYPRSSIAHIIIVPHLQLKRIYLFGRVHGTCNVPGDCRFVPFSLIYGGI